jgi:biopolymer transport protein ExbB/biopolymer transport protein TolQ
MIDALLSLLLMLSAGAVITGIAFWLVKKEFFIPVVAAGADAIRLPRRLAISGLLAFYISLGMLSIVAGMLGVPSWLLARLQPTQAPPTQPAPLPDPVPRDIWDPFALYDLMGLPARLVFWLLLLMSMWSIAVAIERIYTYRQARKESRRYRPLIAQHLKEGRLKEAIALSSSKEYRHSHLARVILAGLQEYEFQRERGSAVDLVDTVRDSIQRATTLTSHDLKRGISGLAAIGTVAPFVGLLGTVFGVIMSFRSMSSGSGGLAAVSSGIAEAMVLTLMGLFVAIPAVWIYNYLSARLETLNLEMEDASSSVAEHFVKRTI